MDIKAALARCGANLKKARDERRMTPEALAALSGVAIQEIIAIEAGMSDIDLIDLLRIAEVLNVDLKIILRDY